MTQALKQQTLNTNTTGGKGMMSYLRALAVLFLATAVTASAVQLDSYEVTEELADGSTEVVRSWDGADTSNFSSFSEYQTVIEEQFTVRKLTKSPYAVFARGDGVTQPNETLQSVLQEALDRGIAQPHEALPYLCENLVGATHIADWKDGNFSIINGGLSESVEIIASVDTSNITETVDASVFPTSTPGVNFDESKVWMFGRIAEVILENSESDNAREAFDVIWALIDNSYDATSENYKRSRVDYYHLPLGNYQQAYDICLGLVESGVTSTRSRNILDLAMNTQVPDTEELLEAVIFNSSTDFLSANDEKLAQYWESMDWRTIIQNHTNQEILNMCDKYKAVQRGVAPSFRGVVANTRSDFE